MPLHLQGVVPLVFPVAVGVGLRWTCFDFCNEISTPSAQISWHPLPLLPAPCVRSCYSRCRRWLRQAAGGLHLWNGHRTSAARAGSHQIPRKWLVVHWAPVQVLKVRWFNESLSLSTLAIFRGTVSACQKFSWCVLLQACVGPDSSSRFWKSGQPFSVLRQGKRFMLYQVVPGGGS